VKTLGISPKVLNPVALLFVAGIVLVVLSAVLEDDGSLRDLGLGALGSAVAALGVGFASSPGTVVPSSNDEGSDAALTGEARSRLR
jgi:hypothetical protein